MFTLVGFSSRSSVCVILKVQEEKKKCIAALTVTAAGQLFAVLPQHVASGAVTVPQARAAAAESSFITPLKGKVAQAAGGGEGLEVKQGTVTVTARQ